MKECEHCKTEMEPRGFVERTWKNIGRIRVGLSNHFVEVGKKRPKRMKGNAWVCPKCGRQQADYLALCIADEEGLKIVRRRLIALMAVSDDFEKDWVSRDEAARMMGTTPSKLVKGTAEGSDRVYSVDLGGTVWYNVASIELWKKTGSGLFPLPRLTRIVQPPYDGERPWFDEHGYLAMPISDEQARDACHQGKCDDDVEALMDDIDFHVDEDLGRKYLKALGYDRDEVDGMGPRQIDMNVLWCICGDINEMDDITGSQERWQFVNIKEA